MQASANIRHWSKSLAFRSMLVAAALSFFVQMIANYFLYANFESQEEKALSEQQNRLLSVTANAIALAMWNFDTTQIQEQIDALKNHETFCGARVYDGQNNKMVESEWTLVEGNAAEQVFSSSVTFVDPRTPEEAAKIIGRVELCANKAALLSRLQETMREQILTALIVSLAMGVVSLFSVQLITRPLKQFQAAIQRFSGDRTLIDDPSLLGGNEIGVLGNYFNTMAANLNQTHGELIAAIEAVESAGQAKSEFLANMSHELRTPMHAILAYTKLGLKQVTPETNADLFKFFNNIHTSGERLLKLLNDLLDLSKLEAGKMRLDVAPIDIRELAENALSELHSLLEQKGLKGAITVMAETTKLNADATRLTQVLINIISNAIRYSPQGSAIGISISNHAENDADGLLCQISNQGSPIPESELESIFDKFVQSSKTKSKAGGTGLGLAICREIINAHDGLIWAQNLPAGDGVVFSIFLPNNILPATQGGNI